MIVPAVLRRLRLQAMMARELVNWREAWHAYSAGAPLSELRFRDGLRIYATPRDSAAFLFLEIFGNGCYRAGLPASLSGVAIDIGANIGAFTLDMARRHPGLTVHAYEPDPDTCDVLRRNVAANQLGGRVQVWNEAVAGTAGTVRLWRGSGAVLSSAHLQGDSRGEPRDVRAVTLGTVLSRVGERAALLKMDCEGSEAEILEAGIAALEDVDRIVAEYHVALVPDVLARIQRVLEPAFTVRVDDQARCGPMIRARRAGMAVAP